MSSDVKIKCTTVANGCCSEKDEESALVASLWGCARNKDLCRGSELHNDILRRGSLERCSDALVTMYTKCGALTKATELFNMYKSKDVFTWTTLIAGYVQKGQSQLALKYFEQMQHEGFKPDAVTYACVLKACASIKALDKGEQIHDEVAKQGLLGNNVGLGNALVNMYCKCGTLAKAHQVLEELLARDVVSWNTIILGYAEHGQAQQSLSCFERMQGEGFSPDAVTFICILKACGSLGGLGMGRQIHDEISKQGLLKRNTALGNALLNMYTKCGALEKAQEVLQELHFRDVISWNSLIAGYVEHDEVEKAMFCFEQMQCDGLFPDAITYASILKACGQTRAIQKGAKIHDQVVHLGLLRSSTVLGNALVDMYAKCGALAKAHSVLEELPRRDAISWNALIDGYAEHEEIEQALNCLERMQQEGISPQAVTFISILKACATARAAEQGEKIHDEIAKQGLLKDDVVLGTALVDMYAKCGAFTRAQQVLQCLLVRNVLSWTALIAGYVDHCQPEQAVSCFERMKGEGFTPNGVTFMCMLKAHGSLGAIDTGKKIHNEIEKQGLLANDILLGTALVDMYAKCGVLAKARQVLEELPVRNVVSWNVLIAGYAEDGESEQSLNCFQQMKQEGLTPDLVTYTCILKACGDIGADDKGQEIHDEIAKQGFLENNVVLGNALVDMYARSGALRKARLVLEELCHHDVIAWNALIAGYTEHGEVEEALKCFEEMQREGLSPEPYTFLCILKACGSIGATEKGGQVHDEVAKQGLLGKDIALGTALVEMYAKCGALAKAQQVLEELPSRDVVAWNVLLAGYAEHGESEEALNCFGRMESEGIIPNASTFSCVLSSCSCLGLVDSAQMFFAKMVRKYGIKPTLEHCTCMIDLLGRIGHLEKAVKVIDKMPSCDTAVWLNLLVACRKLGDVEVGRWAFGHAV